jgi:sugar lactone lactonase YvrE
VVSVVAVVGILACSAPTSAPSRPSPHSELWIANDDAQTGLVELSGSRRIIEPSDLDGPKAIAFDPSGNLWVELTRTPVEDTVLPAIFEYTAAQLDSAAPTPSVVLADSSLTLTGGLAFDAAGNLWIASVDNCEIVEYAAGQWATPTLKLTQHCTSPVIGPNALAFDAHGNLWVGDIATHTLYEYPRATSSPTIVIGLPNMMMPAAIAFDAAGDLWVTSNDSTVYDYASGQLAASGSPTPKTTLALSGTRLVSLAFDNSGDLWLANFASSTIDELSASQLRSSGIVTPVTVVSGPNSVNAPTGLAFSPRVSGLPLFTRRR